MSGSDSVFAGLIQKAKVRENPKDYRRGGLLYCGECGVAKQCRIKYEGIPIIVGCMCQCEEQRFEQEKCDRSREEHALHVQSLRVQGIRDNEVRGYTFPRAEPSKNILRCQTYVQRWKDMLEHNNGLLFWGNVGTGKTFAAACIANALIDNGVPALVTSFPRILNSGWDKTEIIGQMKEFPLLVIDDLGVERSSEYALEIVQMVVDERYKSGMPLIVTTNLTRQELENPKDMRFSRIYDRVLEMCVPVYFDGPSRRKKTADDKMRFAREVFG